MSSRLKVLTIVGTRPEIIRLSRVITALDAATDHVLAHTGQNYDYELNEIFFTDLGLRRPDHFLDAAGKTPAETIGNIIVAADALMRDVRPDAALILGDTNSCLSAISAKRLRIPVFHMEAGNRCFDERVPEEINRRIVDHISDVNLPYSDISRDYLLREGLPPDRIIKTGSPMYEVLAFHEAKIKASDATRRLHLVPGEFFVVSAHREENVDSPRQLARLGEVLNAVAERYDLPLVVSTHPRTRNRVEAAGLRLDDRVRLVTPLGFTDYVRLQLDARAVLSDSGTVSEEASILNIPALNLREAHERPEAMEEAAVVMTGLDADLVLQALDVVTRQQRGAARDFRLVADYSAPNVSAKVVRILLSYAGYVRRTVWRET